MTSSRLLPTYIVDDRQAHLTMYREAPLRSTGSPQTSKSQLHLSALTEGNMQKYTTYASHIAFPPGIKRYDEHLTPVSLESWVSSCPFIASSPWQHWQGHPYCWHFSPPSPHRHRCLLWPGSPAKIAIYKNSWDSSADQAFLQRHYRFNRRMKSWGVLTIFLCTCKEEGESQSTEQPSPVPIRPAHCVSQACTIPKLALDAEHVCQPHQ